MEQDERESVDIFKVRLCIKKQLKKNGYSYEDVAKVLGLKVSSVKRLMSSGDLSLGRIEKISSLFGLKLLDFIEIAKNDADDFFQLSIEQEESFLRNPIAFYLLLVLGAGVPLKKLSSHTGLNDHDIKEALHVLLKLELIEPLSETKIKLKARGPFKLRPDGRLKREFFAKHAEIVKKRLLSGLPANSYLNIFELYLSEKLQKQMQSEMQELYVKYAKLSKIDHSVSNQVRACTGVMSIMEFDGWKETLLRGASDLRR